MEKSINIKLQEIRNEVNLHKIESLKLIYLTGFNDCIDNEDWRRFNWGFAQYIYNHGRIDCSLIKDLKKEKITFNQIDQSIISKIENYVTQGEF